MALEPKDVLVRMQEDLQRALQKAPGERRWVMVIDLRKCVGCHGCTIACVAENKLPPGVVYRPALEQERGTYMGVFDKTIQVNCDESSRFPKPAPNVDHPKFIHITFGSTSIASIGK